MLAQPVDASAGIFMIKGSHSAGWGVLLIPAPFADSVTGLCH
jgi:hypothetical protein